MALSLVRANRILTKAGLDYQIRKADDAERAHGFVWVVAPATEQALHGWATLNQAIHGVLEAGWDDLDMTQLTLMERAELCTLVRRIAHQKEEAPC